MAKKRAKPATVSDRSKHRKTPAEAAPNLFERLYTRKKFDILGKKGKNERTHGRSVHDAADKVSAVCKEFFRAVLSDVLHLSAALALTVRSCCCHLCR